MEVEYDDPAWVRPHTTQLIAFDNGDDNGVSVYADLGWPDQQTAVELLSHTADNPYDVVTRILAFIRECHAWQAAHPR